MANEAVLYRDRIVENPRVMLGKPVVRGTRIAVEVILEELAYNPDLTELFGAHPDLTIEDVQACLAFALHLVKQKRARRDPVLTGAHPVG